MSAREDESRARIPWVSEFAPDGIARHYPIDSDNGIRIVAALAAAARPTCARSGCAKPSRPRAETCSLTCAKAVRRAQAAEALNGPKRRKSAGRSRPTREPESGTKPNLSPGQTRTEIADRVAPNCCQECGADLSHLKADARFCSDAHRKQAARKRSAA